MKYTLNIGCNVNEKPAFSPAFALSKAKKYFSVIDSASFTNSYPNGKGEQIEEKTLVVTVDCANFEEFVDCGVFNLAVLLDQWATAFAPEGHLGLGRLGGPRYTEWNGGVFNADYFVTLEEAKRREAAELAENKNLRRDLGL